MGRRRSRRKPDGFFERRFAAAGSTRYKRNTMIAVYPVLGAVLLLFFMKTTIESQYNSLFASSSGG